MENKTKFVFGVTDKVFAVTKGKDFEDYCDICDRSINLLQIDGSTIICKECILGIYEAINNTK